MNSPLNFARWICSFLFTAFITFSFLASVPCFNGDLTLNTFLGLLTSFGFCSLLFSAEKFFRKFDLKTFNTLIFGLFIGTFFGAAISDIFNTIVYNVSMLSIIPDFFVLLIKSFIYLIGVYLGVALSLSYQDDLFISLPFIKFTAQKSEKKEVILSESVISDPRLFDFLSTGILNNRLIIPSFIIKNLTAKNLEIFEKLKTIENLNLKEDNTDFNQTFDIHKKTLLLAKITKSSVLIGDRFKEEGEAFAQYINLNSIASSLKNAMCSGETIEIKVQRYGKEPKQGVGYLEDGTMVVINNGGEFIGEVIETKVISVKQTSAGRIIFTNAAVEEDGEYAYTAENTYQNNHD